jgi:hypothetical protein
VGLFFTTYTLVQEKKMKSRRSAAQQQRAQAKGIAGDSWE